jgi:hypothetical protein
MNRRFFMFAMAVMALVMFALGSTAATTVASAQDLDSCCLRIYNNTDCHTTICVVFPDGSTRCVLLYAHTREHVRFDCAEPIGFSINDVCGPDHRLIPGDCVNTVLRGGCCAHACLKRGDDGCYEIHVHACVNECGCP